MSRKTKENTKQSQSCSCKKGKINEIPLLNIDGSKTASIEISDKLVKLK